MYNDIERGICIKTLEGHTERVKALVNLEKGKIASASEDKTIKVWNVRNGKCLKTLEGHEDKIKSLLKLKEKKIASGSRDKTIKIWNWEEGVCLKTLVGHDDIVWSLINLREDKIVSTCFEIIKIWNLNEETCLETFECESKIYSSLNLDENKIVFGCENKIIIYNVTQSETRIELNIFFEIDEFYILSLIKIDNDRFACGNSFYIKIWNLKNRECEKILKGHIIGLAFGLTKLGLRHIASAKASNNQATIKVWDIIEGCCVKTLKSHSSEMHSLINIGENKIASAEDKDVKIWYV